jgi:hypothetical protein
VKKGNDRFPEVEYYLSRFKKSQFHFISPEWDEYEYQILPNSSSGDSSSSSSSPSSSIPSQTVCDVARAALGHASDSSSDHYYLSYLPSFSIARSTTYRTFSLTHRPRYCPLTWAASHSIDLLPLLLSSGIPASRSMFLFALAESQQGDKTSLSHILNECDYGIDTELLGFGALSILFRLCLRSNIDADEQEYFDKQRNPARNAFLKYHQNTTDTINKIALEWIPIKDLTFIVSDYVLTNPLALSAMWFQSISAQSSEKHSQ